MPYRATLGVPERPVTPLHFTVEPSGGASRLAELDDEQLRSVSMRLRELTGALGRAHGCEGFNVFVNDGRHGAQSTGELPEEDARLRFHVLGRRRDEPVAPTTILNAPEEYPLERITDAERAARLDRLETDLGTADPGDAADSNSHTDANSKAGPSSKADPSSKAGPCSLCDADDAHDPDDRNNGDNRDDAPDRYADNGGTQHRGARHRSAGPAEVVRGDSARVLRPRRPLTPTNVMLAPLRHVTHLAALADNEFVGLFRLFDRVAATFGQVHGCTSYNLFANDGKVAGQHVPHLHVHVFGRSHDEETDPYELLRGLRFNLGR